MRKKAQYDPIVEKIIALSSREAQKEIIKKWRKKSKV